MISYCYPPMAVVGVYRTLKFVKYLREFGWDPIILTLSNPSDYAFNPELFKDIPKDLKVYRTRLIAPLQSWENWSARRRKSGSVPPLAEPKEQISQASATASSAPGLLARFKRHIFAAMSTPDKDAGWLLTALPKTLRLIRAENVDCLYTSTPPHSAHLIGLYAKKLSGLPFVADFRAPWTQNEYFDEMKSVPWQKRLEEKLELSVHRGADVVISNSTWEGEGYRRKYAPVVGEKFVPILNGYDPDDFDPSGSVAYDRFTIVYIGSLYKRRAPDVFLKGLARFLDGQPEARHRTTALFIGPKDNTLRSLAEQLGINDVIQTIDFLPQSEAYKYLFGAHVLLMILGFDQRGKGVIPAKIFEYIPVGRPILALIPEGETAEMVRKYDAGTIITSPDIDQVATALGRYYADYLRNGVVVPQIRIIEEYTRRSQTKQFAELLDLAVERRAAARAHQK